MDIVTVSSVQESPFNAIRRFKQDGAEFWVGRELMSLLGYQKWQRFTDMVDRAKVACENSGCNPKEHFTHLPGLVSGKGRFGDDCEMSRYFCYLVAMNGDPRKPEIAMAQAYFAIKTHEAETIIPEQQEKLKLLELQNENLRLQIEANQSQQKLLEFRHTVTYLPEPIQQKILGYQTIKETEYRDRIIYNDQVINQGDTVNKAWLCQRYGFVSKKGTPNYTQLNAHLERVTLPSEAWKMSAVVRENYELRRDYIEELDKQIMSGERQLWLGEEFK